MRLGLAHTWLLMARWLWTGLLAVVLPPLICLSLNAPDLIGCVFIHRANITCKWTTGDSQTTRYTLSVRRITPNETHWNCSTPNSSYTSCTVLIERLSVNYNFCVSVTAHSHHGDVATPLRCQPGINEIMLCPVKLNSITQVHGQPHCLTLNWEKSLSEFLISASNIREGSLESQIEFNAHGQSTVTLANVTVTNFSFVACPFSPDTEYTVRLRHRFHSDGSPWSQWSNERQGRTAEGAPSSGPIFWRRVIHQEGFRLTSLLWKPLPHYLANGRVLFYNVTCWDENTQVIPDKGNCTSLDVLRTSCVLKLPLGHCSCSICASTAVGTSPASQIWFNKANEKERPPPRSLNITAIHDRSLNLNWAPPVVEISQREFVVEWFVVTQKTETSLHWKRVTGSTTAVITEGLEPFKRYAVSVRALYSNEGPGQRKTEYVYTRQGAPSAGPQVKVQTSGSTVKLSWTLPVEQLHGFIRNYTLHYGTGTRVDLPGDIDQYSLSLSPGHYDFSMQASTEAGEGVIGPITSVFIGSEEETSIILHSIISIGLISLLLGCMGCLAQKKIVKGKLCRDIPDPYQSSLANWNPKTMMSLVSTISDIKYSEVVLLKNREIYSSDSDQDQSLCYLETCSYQATPPTYNPYKCETKYYKNQRTTNMAESNFTSCPAIYSLVLLSKTEPSTEPKHHSFLNVRDIEQPLEGASELCNISTKSIHVLPYLKQRCNLVCPYNLTMDNFTSTPMFSVDASFQPDISSLCLPFPDFNDPYLPV